MDVTMLLLCRCYVYEERGGMFIRVQKSWAYVYKPLYKLLEIVCANIKYHH